MLYIGLKYLLQWWHAAIFNLGNGNGFSVKQVIDTAKTITEDIKVVESDRRSGDSHRMESRAEGWDVPRLETVRI